MNRDAMVEMLASRREPWDIVVIGGGATGAGIAVDAASRGHRVALFERHDFGKGTSSRSTKLIHGGVRYLERGNVALVMEALRERGRLLRNAPHLVTDLPFVVPTYSWWESPFYGVGLKIYDLLAGKYRFGMSRLLSKAEVLERLPTIETEGLRGGIVYHDGQFDDARLLIHLLATAADWGACVLNYFSAVGWKKSSGGEVEGVLVRDAETGDEYVVDARVVINATGAFCDELRRQADPRAEHMVAPSQGSHLVLDGSFLAGKHAILAPHTADGRVMFAIPWHGHVVVGTTDVAVAETPVEPIPSAAEIDLILQTAGRYLARKPERSDVLSAFAGIRPLVRESGAASTASLSREHVVQIDPNGLVTIVGGKWTTYRQMAQDCIDRAEIVAGLDSKPCRTKRLPLHGFMKDAAVLGHLAVHGSNAPSIRHLAVAEPELGKPLHESLPYIAAEVVWAVRQEMARSVEDVLARRTRALFLNARAAMAMAENVAALMSRELGKGDEWRRHQVQQFHATAMGYCIQAIGESNNR